MPCSYFKAVWGFILIVGPASHCRPAASGDFLSCGLPCAFSLLKVQRMMMCVCMYEYEEVRCSVCVNQGVGCVLSEVYSAFGRLRVFV